MKNEKVVKQSFGVGAGVNILLTVALTYVGLVARAEYFDPVVKTITNEHAEMMVLHTFTDLVPCEFQIAVLIAFFAAILSTSDTYLFLLSLNVTNDLLPNKEENAKRGSNASERP